MNAVLTSPPAPAAPPAATPDDLLRMGDDGKRYELVNGKLDELNVSFLSSYVAGEAYDALKGFVKPRNLGWVVPEGTSFQCFADDRSKVRRADTAFVALARLTQEQAAAEGHCTLAPDLVVEVISPNDFAKVVNQKVADWLKAGVRLVWVIDPEAKTVFCHDRDQPGVVAIRREADTLTGEPV